LSYQKAAAVIVLPQNGFNTAQGLIQTKPGVSIEQADIRPSQIVLFPAEVGSQQDRYSPQVVPGII
jgi:hypothetical protein